MRLDSTSAIVIGAASGLGAATATALAEQGARVFGLDLDITRATEIKGVTYLAADVTSEEQVTAAVSAAAAEGPLRTVVNCAGIGPSVRILGRKGRHDLVLYAKVIQVNLIGTFTVLAVAAEAIAATEPLALRTAGRRGEHRVRGALRMAPR